MSGTLSRMERNGSLTKLSGSSSAVERQLAFFPQADPYKSTTYRFDKALTVHHTVHHSLGIFPLIFFNSIWTDHANQHLFRSRQHHQVHQTRRRLAFRSPRPQTKRYHSLGYGPHPTSHNAPSPTPLFHRFPPPPPPP